jgi:hypothetical protein
MRSAVAAGAAPKEIDTSEKGKIMSLRARISAGVMAIAALAALALVAGADWIS